VIRATLGPLSPIDRLSAIIHLQQTQPDLLNFSKAITGMHLLMELTMVGIFSVDQAFADLAVCT